MALITTAIFLSTVAVPLVECGCNYLLAPFKSTDYLCHKWYDQAVRADEYTFTRYECIFFVKENCPGMINTIVTSFNKRFDGTHEIWTTEGTASSPTGEYKDLFFHTNEIRSVCSKSRVLSTDCDFWWSIAKNEKAKEKHRKVCIDRMNDYCPEMIFKAEEKVHDDDQGCLSAGSKTVTYEYKGERTSLDR